ncbi:ABC transporter ATP-binding protein [Halosimplex aquaticum]|uniref:ABC transporter ATP-binding protein n=1 Tax=Halosimplex aquaticum TaxID=3026162 RepID=A0ABD5XWE1_9EURY|nr:ABC transporter ATP-binding protein [Halosimplex aquaticum]
MTATLVAEDVRRTYGDTVALDGVSLSVGAGEVFALVGPNGAGKTTLVRALTGTTDAEGSVTVFGTDPRQVDRERIGLLPQAFDPPARLTARELLTYYAGLYDDSRDADAVLADVGLTEAADTWYENLSGGQQRRTCVGATLVNDPDLLFLDEPTTGIDPAGRRSLWDLLESLAAGGTTIVLTTHDMAEAHRLADRVGLLADGRLVAVDDPDALVAEYGGESRLVVETDAEPAALDLSYPVERSDGALVVSDVPPEAIGDVVDALDAAGASYDALSWSEPDLEDVYLQLAGGAGREYGHGAGAREGERSSGRATAEGER